MPKIRRNRKLIAVPGVWCPVTLHTYGCVFCSIAIVSVYMCVRMPLRLKSIVRAPLSQALLGYLITSHHLCAYLMYWVRWLCGNIPKTKWGIHRVSFRSFLVRTFQAERAHPINHVGPKKLSRTVGSGSFFFNCKRQPPVLGTPPQLSKGSWRRLYEKKKHWL